MLNKLFGKYDSVEEINFETFPNQFVLKTNNASGTIIIVKDKSILNINETRKKLNNWLKVPFTYNNAELHYEKIPPCIISEEYLYDKTQPELIDYKFFCFNGIPECIFVVSERSKKIHSFRANVYDMKWNRISKHLIYPIADDVPKPTSFDIMVEACMKLGKDIPFVRIDFYEVNGKPYFGEMTFTPGFIFTRKYYEYLGTKLNLDNYFRL